MVQQNTILSAKFVIVMCSLDLKKSPDDIIVMSLEEFCLRENLNKQNI